MKRALVNFTIFALFGLCLSLFGCARLLGPADDLPPGATAETLWRAFMARQESMAAQGGESFRLRASLNYASPRRSHRLLLAFRGDYALPVRLDVAAGIGTPVAFWRESADGFLAFFPDQNAAFFHEDGRKACAALGFQTPFSLAETAAALSGRLERFVPANYVQSARVSGGYEYRFNSGQSVQSLTLDGQGRPVRLTGFATPEDSRPWIVELSDYPENPAEPQRAATVSMWRGGKKIEDEGVESAVLRVKSFETSPDRAAPETLKLNLPPGAQLRRLDESCPLPEIQS